MKAKEIKALSTTEMLEKKSLTKTNFSTCVFNWPLVSLKTPLV